MTYFVSHHECMGHEYSRYTTCAERARPDTPAVFEPSACKGYMFGYTRDGGSFLYGILTKRKFT